MDGSASGGYPSPSPSGGSGPSAAADASGGSTVLSPAPAPTLEVFALSADDEDDKADDDEELLCAPEADGPGAVAGGRMPTDSLDVEELGLSAADSSQRAESWYTLDEAEATSRVEQLASELEAAPLPAAASGSRFGSVFASASALRQKASPFFSNARKAIVEEAKLVAEDVRDVASGVREGMQLTSNDLEVHTKNWRGVLGARFRQEKNAEPPAESSSTAAPASSSASSTPGAEAQEPNSVPAQEMPPAETKPHVLQALRQNLAATADVSKDLWKDVRELKQEFVNEVKLSVVDIKHVSKQVWQGRAEAEKGPEVSPRASESGEVGTGSSGDNEAVPRSEGDGQIALERVKGAVLKTAGGLREGLRQRWQEQSSPGLATESSPAIPPSQDAYAERLYWNLPSTRANYVSLAASSEGTSEPQSAGDAAINPLRSLGGKLKGTLAKRGREVSSGVASIAQNIGQNLEKGKEQYAARSGKPAGGTAKAPDEEAACDGDSIFEIGSDGDGGWSDVDVEAELSDGSRETSSTHETASQGAAPGGEVHPTISEAPDSLDSLPSAAASDAISQLR